MIATAPLIGSHYFCDIAAGIAVALLAIAVARRTSETPAGTPSPTARLPSLRDSPHPTTPSTASGVAPAL